MRKPFLTGLILAVILTPAASAQARPRQSTTLKLVDSRGAEVRLTLDENTEVLVLGTWCPTSRRLDTMLKDGLARRYTRNKRLVYVFDYDELAHRAAPAVRSGKVSQATLDAYVRSQPPGALVVDRDFLSHVAARQVLFYDDKHPIEHEVVPVAFSDAPNRFHLNYGTWLVRNLGMPRDVKDKLFALHPAEGGG
ncbi:MAG TPA: hypothetical protein VJ997_15710 [Longimicrobiales bacterium]|nr:hypothetical protein [Longimicrobiales bacterium]